MKRQQCTCGPVAILSLIGPLKPRYYMEAANENHAIDRANPKLQPSGIFPNNNNNNNQANSGFLLPLPFLYTNRETIYSYKPPLTII